MKTITAGELVTTEFSRSEALVEPWLRKNQIAMLHAWRGVGKSFFALAISQAITSGSSFLKWATKKANVLYLDGEMGLSSMKERLLKIDSSAPYSSDENALRFFTSDQMGGVPWNLTQRENQAAIERLSEDINLLIIDNLSAFTRSLPRETDKQAWYRFRDWLLNYTSESRSVLILHHTGKNGTQRGLSDYEDPLDTSIHLKTPEGHHISQGTVFELHFQKSQDLYGQDLESLLIELIPLDDGLLKWTWKSLSEFRAEEKESRDEIGEQLSVWGRKDDDPLF